MMDTDFGDAVDSSVGFLYKTMLQRDPKKRRVKPVQKHLLQLDFGGLDDSEDDSDFEVAKESDHGSEDGSDHEERSSKKSATHSESGESDDDDSSSSDDADDDDDDDEEESKDGVGFSLNFGADDDSEDDEDYVPRKDTVVSMVTEVTEKAKSTSKEEKPKIATDDIPMAPPRKLKMLICCVCLGDISEEDDEIVECDGCGVSVHEGCYGIGESQSTASTESSASTEPWFCDACKAGTKPHCELCPNSIGIYKETDAGRWVHIVCALYIPGVAFGDVDKLSPVTLFEMPYAKWGTKECCLCEDVRFSRTGVCIGCDAGMCRNYFHVTCAQREGLLSEASPDEDIADPFYAYCKQHADKSTLRAKRRNWLAIQSHCKQHAEQEIKDEKEKTSGESTASDLQLRFQRKLNRHRQKYLINQSKKPPSWVPTEKMPRMLTSSASAMKKLIRKAELLGIYTQASDHASNKDIRKKWHVAPALSVNFISYYLDRNERMNNMKGHLNELLNQREKLREQEKILRVKYDQLSNDVEKLRESTGSLRGEGEKMYKILTTLNGSQVTVPDLIRPKKPLRTAKRDMPRSPPAVIHQCGICHKTHDQHLLAKCDACKQYYHLGCLDPPLSRMPKKTKLQGWQCSECVSSTSGEESEHEVDPNAPRKLREKIKEPIKFTPPMKEKQKRGKKGKRKKMGKKRPKTEEETNADDDMPVLKKERPYRTPKVLRLGKMKDVRTECVVCNKPGNNGNLVRCDECKLCYHFHCLDPPLRKSPKQRGYSWHCTACDPTEGDSKWWPEIDPALKKPPKHRGCTTCDSPKHKLIEDDDDEDEEEDEEEEDDIDETESMAATENTSRSDTMEKLDADEPELIMLD